MKDLAQMLATASGKAEVVQAVLGYLSGEFDRGAFLRLKGGVARGIQAVGDGVALEGFPGYAAELGQTRELRRVVEEKRVFLGEVGEEDCDGALVAAMGAKAPAATLLVPVSLGGQVAAVICANDRHGRLGGGCSSCSAWR